MNTVNINESVTLKEKNTKSIDKYTKISLIGILGVNILVLLVYVITDKIFYGRAIINVNEKRAINDFLMIFCGLLLNITLALTIVSHFYPKGNECIIRLCRIYPYITHINMTILVIMTSMDGIRWYFRVLHKSLDVYMVLIGVLLIYSLFYMILKKSKLLFLFSYPLTVIITIIHILIGIGVSY